MKRNTYIDNVDVDKATELYLEELNIEGDLEEVAVVDSLGRVTWEAVYAAVSSPGYNASAMDGIAVTSKNTEGANESNPLTLIEREDFKYVNTGNPIKEPYDSVIMIEDVLKREDDQVQILRPAYPYQHVRQIGEDIVATEMIIPSRHKVRPMDIGALISGGIKKVNVYKRPKIGIIPTGSEIVEDISQVMEGTIIDSNSHVFKGLVTSLGGIPNRYPPMEDDYDKLKQLLKEAVKENDMVIVNAGSAAGTKDFTVNLIQELGRVVVHGVAMKPGKPTILGVVEKKPVIGIPGYPVSAFMVFDVFAKPLILKFLGDQGEIYETTEAVLSRRMVSSLKNKEIVRVTLGKVKDRLIATPLSGGAGVSMSLVKADGLGIIPRNIEGYEAGDKIEVELLKPLSTIRNKLLSIGSHDLVMDIIGDMMKLTSSHVGSMGGILSLRRDECHLAPIHLLDMDTGEYNISYVKKYFPGRKMALIKGLQRSQGFIVQKGNPDNIEGCSDLLREDVIFANRQRGAGTRVLLDYQLKKEELDPAKIRGYQREFTTHMAVAAAVKNNTATTGLGAYSAAKAMELHFVPLANEDYDFLVDAESVNMELIREFIETIKSDRFQSRVTDLGGYGFEGTGNIIWIE
ncbi:molybdopterin biosynthesis protein [Gudongella sp. DL1XJH-153]|uniref:molybdopterin biosynthesis protein n=1 Tax=Gudongella sp. DL1XJH-153 TaxID=3409804 RepID=UPI003BB5FCB8